MSSRSGPEEITLASPTEQQANALVATAMDAKLMLATSSGDVQQLKDLVNKQEQDSKMVMVVMAKQQAAASTENPRPHQENMDPRLLELVSSGSSEKLKALLNGQASGNGGITRRASSYGDDTEANKPILEGVTAEGDTALHVVAACGQGDYFFTRSREAKHLVQQNVKRRWWHCCWRVQSLTRTERQALLTTYGYGDGDNFLESARIIYGKAKHLLFVQNNKGDTPLHCAARAGKSNMVACLIDLAFTEGEDRMKELLRKENKHKETALHEAVRVGNKDIVDLLMGKDSELASIPEDGGASPMYLAIMLNQGLLQDTLYKKSHGNLSFAGPNGQNVLHAAILRHQDISELEWNGTHCYLQNMNLTTQRDENGRTPLHFAAARMESSSICRQVLKANPDALYQPDHTGFFPIHVAASEGAFSNVDMFVTKYPGSASLRNANGGTFLHVAVVKGNSDIIGSACRNLSLSWIMNMVDNDGNTALHLAVKDDCFKMFCSLLGNPQVNLNLPNNRGQTPLDIAEAPYNLMPKGVLLDSQIRNYKSLMQFALTHSGAVTGVYGKDHFKHSITLRAFDENKEMEVVKESSETLCIGSVLIATVTFGATFAVPGGYIADDHNNGGSPVLARKFAFQGFIWSNTFAFVFSTIATVLLMQSGNPLFHLWGRKVDLGTASNFVSISITCLVVAFGLAAYVVLAPVSQFTAVLICCITSAAVLPFSQMSLFITAQLSLLNPYVRGWG